MSNWTECVLDASMGARDGLFTFCPIEGDVRGDFRVVTGMNFVSSRPPDRLSLVAIVHPDGQAAVERFCDEHREALEAMSSDP